MPGDLREANAAATCIQARFRGVRSRSQQRKAVVGITKLQARQRGRFTRREFAQLLQFSREQELFLRATKRRQLRIWRNEQELHFLQHTTAEQLEEIRDFQKKRGARAIQRAWREYAGPPPTDSKSQKSKSAPPIFTFDPFQLQNQQSGGRILILDGNENGSKLDPQRLEKDLLGPLRSAPRAPPALFDREAFSQRRKNVQDRIKQRIQIQKDKLKVKPPFSSSSSNQQDNDTPHHHENLLLSPTRKQVNRRRELYNQLVQLRKSTARRVKDYEAKYRATGASRDLLSAKLGSSCENRLQVLQQDLSTRPMFSGRSSGPSSQSFNPDEHQLRAQTAHFQAETQQWDTARKATAWGNHSQIVHSTLNKQSWWQTSIAGYESDIRRVRAKSPFENEKKVWLWPSQSGKRSSTAGDNTGQSIEQEPHASELDAFVFSLGRPNNQEAEMSRPPEPVDDREASEWWRAHCMQPHLNFASSHESNDASNNEDDSHHAPLWASSMEALANPIFHRLYLASQRRDRLKEHKFEVNATLDRFTKHVNQRVGEIEMQIEVNTKMQQDIALRRLQIKKRRTKEENAIVTIQRVFRGAQGRKHAVEVRAEYFVMVRGRAIRKGKCEECGEQPAVLECTECEESLHFCPVCWVQVHSTRRRKTHAAIPMNLAAANANMKKRVPAAAAAEKSDMYKERPVALQKAISKKIAEKQSEAASGCEAPQRGTNSGAKLMETGQRRTLTATFFDTNTPKSVADAKAGTNLPPATLTEDNGNDHQSPDLDESNAFGAQEDNSGDSSCPPPALGSEASAEKEPAAATVSLTVDTGGGTRPPPKLSGKPSQKSTTPTNASKPAAVSRLSLKQRMGEPAVKSEDTSDIVASSSSSSTRVKDEALPSKQVGPPSRTGLTQGKSPRVTDGSEGLKASDTVEGTGKGTKEEEGGSAPTATKPAALRVSLKQRLPTATSKKGEEAPEMECQKTEIAAGEVVHVVLPSGADGDAANERKAAKSGKVSTPAAQLSLKQRMSGSSFPGEATSGVSRVATPLTGTSVPTSDRSEAPPGPATRDAAALFAHESVTLRETEVSVPLETTDSQTPQVAGDAATNLPTAVVNPEPGVKGKPKAVGGEELETKTPVAAVDSEPGTAGLIAETPPHPAASSPREPNLRGENEIHANWLYQPSPHQVDATTNSSIYLNSQALSASIPSGQSLHRAMHALDLDAFTLAHMLGFLDHASLAALTLSSRACGASAAPIRQLFLQRSCVRIPETLSSSPAASSIPAPLAAAVAMTPMFIDEDAEMDEATSLATLHALLERLEVTKLSIRCSESDALWADTLAQFLTLQVANKVTMVRIKQALASSNATSLPSAQQPPERDDAAPVPIVHAILSRMRRNHQQTTEEKAQVAGQWFQLTDLMPNLKELDLSLIKVTTIEWLPMLAKLEKLMLDAAELPDQASLAPLRQLTSVKSLSVQNYMVPRAQEIADMQQLTSLWLNESSVLEDLSSIRRLKHLQELKLTHMSAVQDLSFVQKLAELRVLKANFVGQDQWLRLPELRLASSDSTENDQEDTAVAPVSLSLPHLHSLTLQRVRLRGLNVLALCPNLRNLSLHAHEITSIEMLVAVPELRDLKLSIDIIGGRKLNLSPLTMLSKLLSLELVTLRGRFNSDTLPALPSLKTLVVPAMDDFEPICQRQQALSSLTVRECSQVDIDYAPVLAELPLLTKLTLTFPVVKGRSESASARALDLSPLQLLTELRSLSLIHVSTEDLSPLSALTNLKSLDLSAFYSTQPLAPTISDFAPLTSLMNLRSLSVAGRSEFTETDLELLTNSKRSNLTKLRRINTTKLVIPSFSGVLW